MKIKQPVFAALIILLFSISVFSFETRSTGNMTWLKASVLGVVEGLTEYLPVSSTGHLILANALVGLKSEGEEGTAANAYAICIQFGAIIAVLFLYRKRILSIIAGLAGKSPSGLRLGVNTLIAFLPAVVAGLLLEDYIKQFLFGLWPVAAAWLAGGILILFISQKTKNAKGNQLELLTIKGALLIGVVQCAAMWPGVSRSLATILGGIAAGLSVGAAVEFSFVLGLVTLSAATAWDALKYGQTIIDTFGVINPAIGLAAAFVSAVIAVKFMVSWLTRHSLAVFGWYRIILAFAVGAAMLAGML
jgi:undecaprenyl-diphosphatase